MTDENYPYDKIFDQPHSGLIRQELITYTELDGRINRTTVVRTFFGSICLILMFIYHYIYVI